MNKKRITQSRRFFPLGMTFIFMFALILLSPAISFCQQPSTQEDVYQIELKDPFHRMDVGLVGWAQQRFNFFRGCQPVDNYF